VPAAFRDRFEMVHRHRAAAPNALWQADHTLLDLLILDEGGKPARPWLTTVVDDYSRAVAGYTVFLGAPCVLNACLALRHAIGRKHAARTTRWRLVKSTTLPQGTKCSLKSAAAPIQDAVMDTDTIYPQLTTIMQDVFDDEVLVAHPDLTADDVEEWDSLSHLRLIMAVQKAFNVKFSAGEIGKLKKVSDLVQLIQAKAS